MSLSLGEKLRQAREDKGLTLSEVSEHTRISSLYLESIERNDYKILPGGIFNKGFVKSYAKFVGLNEQEALRDYSEILAQTESAQPEERRAYRPEVLTDGGASASSWPTIVVAGVMLAAMTVGILYLVSYLRRPSESVVTNAPSKTPANTQTEGPSKTEPEKPGYDVPDMAALNIELKAINPLTVLATVDAEPPKRTDVAGGSSVSFTPKQSLTLNYNRWNAQNVQLAINGKPITLPAGPLDTKDRDRIIFTISKDNLAQIWTNAAISADAAPAVTDANANTNANGATEQTPPPTVAPRQTPVPRPSLSADTATNSAPPATPAPAPTRKVVVVSNAPSNKPQ